MSDGISRPDELWRADFESAAEQQLEAWMSATPSQRLAWLEQAIEFAWKVGALPRQDEQAGRNRL